MDPFALDLSLEAIEGATHDLGTVTLWCHLRANTFNPGRPRPQFTCLWRAQLDGDAVVCDEPAISNAQIIPLVTLLNTLGWPGRELRVTANDTPLAGVQEVRLWAKLNGQESEARLVLRYGGWAGPDAEALREICGEVIGLGGLPSQEHWINGTWPARAS